MGKSRSYEVIEYRNKIISSLISSPKVLNLFDTSYEDSASLIYSKIFPYENIPEVITKQERCICFDLRTTLDNFNPTYNDITIWFFIFCHKDVTRTPEGLWYDCMVCALDEIFGGKNILGVGTTELKQNTPYVPNTEFKGRMLTFVVKDFTDGKKNGN